MGAGAGAEAAAAAAAPAAPEGDDGLPPNWIKVFDDGSQTYYYFNTVSGDSVWDRDEVPAQ